MDADDFRPELIWPYDPRLTPLPPPDVDICAAPVVNVCVNVKWWSHISGMIMRLTYRDAWDGTDDEISDAIESIYKILNVGRSTMGCGCGDSGLPSRYTADGVFQVSYDGGATWVDYPQGDYRNNVILMPPIPGADGDEKKCKTSSNVRGNMNFQADQLIAETGAWGNVSGLIAVAIGILIFLNIFGTLGAATPLLLALCAALFAAGSSGFDAAMTVGVYDTFQCIVYCHMQADGTFTDADITAIKADINAELTGIAAKYLADNVDILGKTGLANMGRTDAGLDADCFDCSPCDPVCDVANWHIVNFNGQDVGAIVATGDGWIEVTGSAHPDFGTPWNAMIQTDNDLNCCPVYSFTQISGDIFPNTFGVLCGNPRWPGSPNNGFSLPQLPPGCNTVFCRGDTGSNFVVRIQFS